MLAIGSKYHRPNNGLVSVVLLGIHSLIYFSIKRLRKHKQKLAKVNKGQRAYFFYFQKMSSKMKTHASLSLMGKAKFSFALLISLYIFLLCVLTTLEMMRWC